MIKIGKKCKFCGSEFKGGKCFRCGALDAERNWLDEKEIEEFQEDEDI